MSKTNPFAGLMAGFRGTRAEESNPDEEEARKARRAEEDKQRDEEDARRAEEDDRRQQEDARRAEEDGSGEPDGKKAEDDDQDPEADADDKDDAAAEEAMDDKEKAAHRRGIALGRKRENARGARIFLAAAEVGRPDLAATLAFTTRNSSAEAGRLMTAAGAAPKPRGRLDDRMANRSEPRPGTGSGGASAGKPSFAERVAAAVKKTGR